MAKASAVLCPAKWDEPFGMVAAEAQAAGTPVIAYRRGALPEIILEERTGFLTPPDDIAAAAQALRAVGRIRRGDCRDSPPFRSRTSVAPTSSAAISAESRKPPSVTTPATPAAGGS